jgi:hypothetical protein
MFTGLTKLFHQINTGSTSLPAKLFEEYLIRAITKAENGEGMALLKAFQSQLRLMKQLERNWAQTDTSHRLLLFNCCDTLTTEDNNILVPSSSLAKHHASGKRSETNYATQKIDSRQELDWDVYEDLMEEYTEMATTSRSTEEDVHGL